MYIYRRLMHAKGTCCCTGVPAQKRTWPSLQKERGALLCQCVQGLPGLTVASGSPAEAQPIPGCWWPGSSFQNVEGLRSAGTLARPLSAGALSAHPFPAAPQQGARGLARAQHRAAAGGASGWAALTWRAAFPPRAIAHHGSRWASCRGRSVQDASRASVGGLRPA